MKNIKTAVVTGGAGFVGSHLVDYLLAKNYSVIVFDNLSTGNLDFLKTANQHPHYQYVQGDLLNQDLLMKTTKNTDLIFHCAASADLRDCINNPYRDIEQNFLTTYHVLEAIRINRIPKLIFMSSAAVYGQTSQVPTPENTASLQTSTYGAAKMSSEAFIEAYSEYYPFQAWIFRFVSLLGLRYAHGVVLDFFQQLKNHPDYLSFLANGQQQKSYLDIEDAIAGIFLALEKSQNKMNIFNLGHDEMLTVTEVANIVCQTLGLTAVDYRYLNRKEGWIGDNPLVHLDTSLIKKLGWRPAISIADAIKRTVNDLKIRNPSHLRNY